MDPNQQNLTDIEEQLRQLEEEISRKKAELEARRQVLLNTGGAVIQGDVDIGGGDFVNRDKYEHHHYHGGEDPATARQAEAAYRQDLAAHCDTLPLRGVDPTPGEGATGRQPLSLAQVYIALDTQRWASAAVIAQALQRASQGQLSGLPAVSSPATTGRDEDTRPLAALEATLVHRCWVLLGKPGSGKSTFVNYLTHALAARAWEHLPGWPEGERDALPILVVLRDFARWLAGQQPLPLACADLLWRFITHELQQRKLERAAQVLEQALDQPGRAVVLLDGLDEVPPDDDRLLARVRDSVTAFAQRYHHSRHLVTCRVLSYQEPGWRLPDFEQAAAQRAEAAAFWREVILLAVGYLVHQNRDLGKPRLLVEELCPDRSPPTDSAWRQVWLAGEVLLEVGLNRIQDSAHGKGLLERVRRRLTELV